MANINQLSVTDRLTSGDQLAVWVTNNGDTRRASLNTLTSYMQDSLTLPGALVTQYAAPSTSGASVSVLSGDTWLILTPTVALDEASIVLPSMPADRAEVNVNCTQAITALAVSAGGTTVTGAPTALAANSFFTMRYDAATAAWYRVA